MDFIHSLFIRCSLHCIALVDVVTSLSYSNSVGGNILMQPFVCECVHPSHFILVSMIQFKIFVLSISNLVCKFHTVYLTMTSCYFSHRDQWDLPPLQHSLFDLDLLSFQPQRPVGPPSPSTQFVWPWPFVISATETSGTSLPFNTVCLTLTFCHFSHRGQWDLPPLQHSLFDLDLLSFQPQRPVGPPSPSTQSVWPWPFVISATEASGTSLPFITVCLTLTYCHFSHRGQWDLPPLHHSLFDLDPLLFQPQRPVGPPSPSTQSVWPWPFVISATEANGTSLPFITVCLTLTFCHFSHRGQWDLPPLQHSMFDLDLLSFQPQRPVGPLSPSSQSVWPWPFVISATEASGTSLPFITVCLTLTLCHFSHRGQWDLPPLQHSLFDLDLLSFQPQRPVGPPSPSSQSVWPWPFVISATEASGTSLPFNTVCLTLTYCHFSHRG